jgi:hypothetical protein
VVFFPFNMLLSLVAVGLLPFVAVVEVLAALGLAQLTYYREHM